MAKFGIGQAITRREDQRLLTGTGKYVDDVPLKNQTHLVFVRSPHAHARIVSIDTSAAKSAAGVIGVFTGAELLADGVGDFPIGPGLKPDRLPSASRCRTTRCCLPDRRK